MCRGNNHGGRRCPASTNKELRREQNRAYYLKRKTAGTVGVKVSPGAALGVKQATATTEVDTTKLPQSHILSSYADVPQLVDIENFLLNVLDDYEMVTNGNSNVTGEKKEAGRKFVEQIKKGFSAEITTPEGKNISCSVSHVSITKNGRKGRAWFTGSISVDGEEAGSFNRAIECETGEEAHMEYGFLSLIEKFQGERVGSELVKHFDAATRATGVTTVKLEANVDVGGYAWAKAGYDWDVKHVADNKAGMKKVTKRLNKALVKASSKGTEAEVVELKTMISRLDGNIDDVNYPTPFEIAMCGKQFGRKGMWAGKKALLGATWHAVRKL